MKHPSGVPNAAGTGCEERSEGAPRCRRYRRQSQSSPAHSRGEGKEWAELPLMAPSGSAGMLAGPGDAAGPRDAAGPGDAAVVPSALCCRPRPSRRRARAAPKHHQGSPESPGNLHTTGSERQGRNYKQTRLTFLGASKGAGGESWQLPPGHRDVPAGWFGDSLVRALLGHSSAVAARAQLVPVLVPVPTWHFQTIPPP